MASAPVVSICCTAFNHAEFIAQALDGFLAQRTDFPFEIIVHDDASTDGTADILRDYERRHPDIIRCILQSENQYRLEKGRVTRIVRAAARADLIALCEGDDHWIDPDKLQAQVDVMRSEPDLSFCFTNAYNEYEDHRRVDYVRTWLGRTPPPRMEQRDIVARNFIPTAGVMYRNERLQGFTEEQRTWMAFDWLLYVGLSSTGPFAYLDRISAVRRVHPGGVISMHSVERKIDVNLELLEQIDIFTEGAYGQQLGQRRAELYLMAMQHGVDTGNRSYTRANIHRALRDRAAKGHLPFRQLARTVLLAYFPAVASAYHRLRSPSDRSRT